MHKHITLCNIYLPSFLKLYHGKLIPYKFHCFIIFRIITGLLPTIGYIQLNGKTPDEILEIICRKLILSGRTILSEQVRKSLSPLIKVPRVDPLHFTITVRDENNEPIINADLLLIAEIILS